MRVLSAMSPYQALRWMNGRGGQGGQGGQCGQGGLGKEGQGGQGQGVVSSSISRTFLKLRSSYFCNWIGVSQSWQCQDFHVLC